MLSRVPQIAPAASADQLHRPTPLAASRPRALSKNRLAEIATGPTLSTAQLDIADEAALASQLPGKFAVLSAAPPQLTVTIADAAAKAGVQDLDLTADVESTRRVNHIADTARSTFIPQTGLAPGFISVVAGELVHKFDSLDSVQLRVGTLPWFPSNALNHNLTWTADGLIRSSRSPHFFVSHGPFMVTKRSMVRNATMPPGLCTGCCRRHRLATERGLLRPLRAAGCTRLRSIPLNTEGRGPR